MITVGVVHLTDDYEEFIKILLRNNYTVELTPTKEHLTVQIKWEGYNE